MRKGIIAGGNFIIDHIKTVDHYPLREELALILDEYSSNGGSAYNILKNLNRLKAPFPLEAVGIVGDDENGNVIIRDCQSSNIDVSRLLKISATNTAFTDVMSEQKTGKRTFFHSRGANDYLDEMHFDFAHTNSKIFHLGYLLMLKKLDHIQDHGFTGASDVFKRAKEHGLYTSADLVSVRTELFGNIVNPSLPFVDYLFINEIEAGFLTELDILENDTISHEKCFEAAEIILNLGVREWVFLHHEDGIIALSRKGQKLIQPALEIPESKIKGTVGAGDAFAAGTLFGIHENFEMEKSIELGVCAAASCLFSHTCSDGIMPFRECISLLKFYTTKVI